MMKLLLLVLICNFHCNVSPTNKAIDTAISCQTSACGYDLIAALSSIIAAATISIQNKLRLKCKNGFNARCGRTTDWYHDFNYWFSAVLSVTAVTVAIENGFEFRGVLSPQTVVPAAVTITRIENMFTVVFTPRIGLKYEAQNREFLATNGDDIEGVYTAYLTATGVEFTGVEFTGVFECEINEINENEVLFDIFENENEINENVKNTVY